MDKGLQIIHSFQSWLNCKCIMSSSKPPILQESFFSIILPFLKFHLHICSKLGSCPVRWDNSTSKRVIVAKGTASLQRLHHWHMNLYIGAQIWGLTRYWRSLSFAQLVISIYFVVGPTLFQVARWSLTLNPGEVARTLNAAPLRHGISMQQSRNG